MMMMTDVSIFIFILPCIRCLYFAYRASHWFRIFAFVFFYSFGKPSAQELAFEVELDPLYILLHGII